MKQRAVRKNDGTHPTLQQANINHSHCENLKTKKLDEKGSQRANL